MGNKTKLIHGGVMAEKLEDSWFCFMCLMKSENGLLNWRGRISSCFSWKKHSSFLDPKHGIVQQAKVLSICEDWIVSLWVWSIGYLNRGLMLSFLVCCYLNLKKKKKEFLVICHLIGSFRLLFGNSKSVSCFDLLLWYGLLWVKNAEDPNHGWWTWPVRRAYAWPDFIGKYLVFVLCVYGVLYSFFA